LRRSSKIFANISATTAAFTLDGGDYMVAAVATFGGGSVELQGLGPDGSTYLSLPTALKLTANGMIAGYCPPGQYKFVVTTATGVYCSERSPTASERINFNSVHLWRRNRDGNEEMRRQINDEARRIAANIAKLPYSPPVA
jgi:hypothetical protein